MTKIASWNVNSIRVRFNHLINFIRSEKPEIVLLQETKCENHAFPKGPLEDLGYNVCIHGQKTFNGVAILSKFPLEESEKNLPNNAEDLQSRYIEAFTGGVRVASVYVPNGQAIDTEKYGYKLSFLEKLRRHLKLLFSYEEKTIIGGDFNVAPFDEDVYNPEKLKGQILCSPKERGAFRALLNEGYKDGLRIDHKKEIIFTWWDYRKSAFINNEGLRIDHFLLSPKAIDAFQASGIISSMRGLDKASDHAPIWCQLV